MVPLNIQTSDFSVLKIFLRLLVPSKNLIQEISLYFLDNQRLTFIIFNEIFQKLVEYYNNLSKKIIIF